MNLHWVVVLGAFWLGRYVADRIIGRRPESDKDREIIRKRWYQQEKE